MLDDLQGAALQLAKQGIAVFPVGLDKKPRNSNGFHGATTDPKQIKAWDWNGGGAIGAAIPEGHFVVDIDPRNGGDKTIKALVAARHTFPATRVVSTKSGGTHRYYKLPAEMWGRDLRGSVGPGVDIKGAGKGYVLLPPSPGYTLKFDSDVVEAPEWLVEEIVKPVVDAEASAPSKPKFFAWEKGTPYGLKALEEETTALSRTGEGGRNNALNRAAFSMAQLVAGGELDEKHALEEMHLVADLIGLEELEIRQTIKSGWEAGLMEPRQAPPTESTAASYSNFVASELSDEEHYWVNWQVEEDPPPFYLHPIIPKHAYVIVYGATESSKSMAFVALAAQASHKGIKSSIYSLENPGHVDRHRLRRLDPDPANLRLTNQHVDVNDNRQLEDLVERNRAGGVGSWEDGGSTDWLIIDTYSHAFNSRSEDGNARAIEFARRIRYAMHKIGCSVILLDHTGYEQKEEPRDASAKRQQVDVGIYMEKVGKWAPGQPSVFTMVCTKSARFGNPFFYRAEIADVGGGLELRWRLDAGSDPPHWGAYA